MELKPPDGDDTVEDDDDHNRTIMELKRSKDYLYGLPTSS